MDLLKPTLVSLALTALAAACASGFDRSTTVELPPVQMPPRLVDTQGVEHDLEAAAAEGKSVALVFWQPWCEACREESEVVVNAVRRHGDDLEVIGIVAGPEEAVDEATVSSARMEWGQNYPTVRDRDLSISEAIGVESVPAIAIFAPTGELVYNAEVPPEEWRE